MSPRTSLARVRGGRRTPPREPGGLLHLPGGNPRTVIGECWVAEASIEAELAEREAEWPLCGYKLARLGGEGVAILGHYTGKDQMVFNLATRLPFRHRGIAQSMLARWSEEGGEHRVRSLLINCGVGGPAEALYPRLGFTDEVYW